MATSSFKNNVCDEMKMEKFEFFKLQDLENGQFDVKFIIQEKIIHAHKAILTSISETLKIMLSNRWSNNDESVMIETYSYDDFYHLLYFIYSGECFLNKINIFRMVDMAEFFAVSSLKEFCDRFLSTMEYADGTIEEMLDFAQQYSLTLFIESIEEDINENSDKIVRENDFIAFKKPFVEFFTSALDGNFKEKAFEAVYKWVEHHITKKTSAANGNNVNLREDIKNEMLTMIRRPNFGDMDFDFLMNFVVKREFFVSPAEYFVAHLYSDHSKTFKQAYDLAEKQKIAAYRNGNFELVDHIEAEMKEIIPLVEFHHFDKQLLFGFVVAKGFLSKEDANSAYEERIRLVNDQEVTARICVDEYDDRYNIENIFSANEYANAKELQKKTFSSSQKPVKKMKFVNRIIAMIRKKCKF